MKPSIQQYLVNLGQRSYTIHIESGCLPQIGKRMATLFTKPSRCMIVSNNIVAPLYLATVKASLEAEDWSVTTFILPDGEQYKSIQQWSNLMDALMVSKLSRNEPIIALGGGVVGDMTGFAASCYRRGIPFIQIPTTVLAQVDSSVGGKTAINHPHGKNMIGAFYQPKLVWIDPLVLNTLEKRQIPAGLAEVIKYGLIRDKDFFSWLQHNMSILLQLDPEAISEAILRSCAHKAEVVMADETEQGQRALLKLGHTFGHAIESMTHYTTYLHGEAVALGTIMASRLSEQLGYAPHGTESSVRKIFELARLPTNIPQFPVDAWLDAMGHDKKNIGNLIRYILLNGIGNAFIAEQVTDQDIHTLITSFEHPASSV